MTPEENETVTEALEALYSLASKLREVAVSLDRLHRAHLIETLAPMEKDDGSDRDSDSPT